MCDTATQQSYRTSGNFLSSRDSSTLEYKLCLSLSLEDELKYGARKSRPTGSEKVPTQSTYTCQRVEEDEPMPDFEVFLHPKVDS